jgi:hypothetical protein
MATTDPISALTALGAAPATGDLLVLVDVSDPSQASSGTTKNMTVANLFTSPTFTGTATLATVAISGNVAVNTNKVTITAASGNTFIAGTLQVVGTTTVGDAVVGAAGANLDVFVQPGGASGRVVIRNNATVEKVVFTNAGALTLASSLTVTTGGITVTGNSTITGTLGGLTGITVASGGVTVTGNSTITGTLTGLTGLTVASGTVTVGSGSAANLVVAAGGGALATNASVGFLLLSSCGGTPTGTPASIPTGTVPCVIDTTGSKFWAYWAGSWKATAMA